jgi:hypothetical protein
MALTNLISLPSFLYGQALTLSYLTVIRHMTICFTLFGQSSPFVCEITFSPVIVSVENRLQSNHDLFFLV